MLHAVEAPVTQNAKEFESGDNFHLQPTAIWSKADTKQKWRKTDNLIFCRLDLSCQDWTVSDECWSNVNLFPLYQRKSFFSQIERCEVVWSPNLGLLIAFISDEMNVGRNLIFRKGWLMYSLSKVEKFEVGGLNLELDCTLHTHYLN